jgi:hypothetical protein
MRMNNTSETFWLYCPNCFSGSPIVNTPSEAYAAAMKRVGPTHGFIKLTKAYNGEPVWIRKDAISSITESGEKTDVYVLETLSPWEIKESAECILEQLDESDER